MDNNFDHWKKLHDKASLEQFNTDLIGQLWLKIKSIIRPELVKDFTSRNSIVLQYSTATKQFEELFFVLSKDTNKSHKILDEYIYEKNKIILNDLDVNKLVSELYKLKIFEWGGDYKNSLDKYLVTHYVKAIKSYDELLSKFDNEINHAVKGYVLNSWYNHWSSILIEHIFKSHKSVLPTVGQIKNVDFFINNIPFDLKVTYFPAEYLKLKRKEKGLPVELTYLKSKAK
jgi:SpoVK/Ycf46/Vps4 family AAA+-type ATPase